MYLPFAGGGHAPQPNGCCGWGVDFHALSAILVEFRHIL
jgi:hypothetical protein